MLWQKLKGKDGDERVKGSSSTKRQIKGFDVVRLKEDITVELMTCLIEAFSMLSEEVIACECEACSDRVRRLLVRQMTLIHFFETESNEEGKSCVLGNQPIEIIMRRTSCLVYYLVEGKGVSHEKCRAFSKGSFGK